MKNNLNKIIANTVLTGTVLVGTTGCSVISKSDGLIPNTYNTVSNSVKSAYNNATEVFKSDTNGYVGKQPITLKTANFHEGTIKDFVSNYVEVESKRDAAEVDREKRCLDNLVGKPFMSKNDLYTDLSSCVAKERKIDIATYGVGAFVIDGLKVYLLLGGVNNSASSTTTNTPITPSNGNWGNGKATDIIIKGFN